MNLNETDKPEKKTKGYLKSYQIDIEIDLKYLIEIKYI